MNLLLLSGSFRRASYSQALLDVIEIGLSKQHHTQRPNLMQLPFCQESDNYPKLEGVAQFIEQVMWADGIVVCTPEYNHSVPAVLKNAIDWASRPAFESALKDKWISIITQSQSEVGGARAQAHLKLIFDATLSKVYLAHEMTVGKVDTVFDGQLKLTDMHIHARLIRYMDGFVAAFTNAYKN